MAARTSRTKPSTRSIWRPAPSWASRSKVPIKGTPTIAETVTAAADALDAVATVTDDHTAVIEEVVADKGYHSNQVLVDLAALDLRIYIAKPDRGRRRWKNKTAARDAVYANRGRLRGA